MYTQKSARGRFMYLTIPQSGVRLSARQFVKYKNKTACAAAARIPR